MGVKDSKKDFILGMPKTGIYTPNQTHSPMNEDAHLKVMRLLEANPQISQRQLAQELGISLGKINYCLKALVEKGSVKARNYRNSKNKLAYAYLLTPKGVKEKGQLTMYFLEKKKNEFDMLKKEIDSLKAEVKMLDDA